MTERAAGVMLRAQQEAHCCYLAAVGTGHILLALVREGSGPAFQALQNLCVDLTFLGSELTRLMERGCEVHVRGRLPLTARAMQAIQYALEEMRNAGHEQVGTGHLLLGVLRDPTGFAAVVMSRVCPGLSLDGLRREVLRLLKENMDTAQQTEPRRADWGGRDPVIAAILSDRAKHVLTLADEEARRLNHECVSLVHVFLALVAEGTRSGPNALLNVVPDLKLAKVRHELEKFAPPGLWKVARIDLPHDILVRKLIAAGFEEARRLGQSQLDAEHLVLGLLSDDCTAHLFAHLGLQVDDVRRAVLRLLDEARSAGTAPGTSGAETPESVSDTEPPRS